MMTLIDLLKRAPKEKKDGESGYSSNEEKSEKDEDSEEEPDFTEIRHMVVYRSVIPDNLSMSWTD